MTYDTSTSYQLVNSGRDVAGVSRQCMCIYISGTLSLPPTKYVQVVELVCLPGLVLRAAGIAARVLHLGAVYQQSPAVVQDEHFAGVACDGHLLLEPHHLGDGNARGRARQSDGLVDHHLRLRHNVRVLYARRHCNAKQRNKHIQYFFLFSQIQDRALCRAF